MIEIILSYFGLLALGLAPVHWIAKKISGQKFNNSPFKLSFSYAVWLLLFSPMVYFTKGFIAAQLLTTVPELAILQLLGILIFCQSAYLLKLFKLQKTNGQWIIIGGLISGLDPLYGSLYFIISLVAIVACNSISAGYLVSVVMVGALDTYMNESLTLSPQFIGILVSLLIIYHKDYLNLIKGQKVDLLNSYKTRHHF